MDKNVVVIHPKDNVAVAIREIKAGERLAGENIADITVSADIPPSHKVAIVVIPADADIVKYGESIGRAKDMIKPGDWVHNHNINAEDK